MCKYASVVLLVTPQGIPLVRNPKKFDAPVWKLPGGKSEVGETAAECAVREMFEEVGIRLSVGDLEIVYQKDKGAYVQTIFRAVLPLLPPLKEMGDEWEEIRVFKPQEVLADRENFLYKHVSIIEPILQKL